MATVCHCLLLYKQVHPSWAEQSSLSSACPPARLGSCPATQGQQRSSVTDDLKKQHLLPLSHSDWLFSWTPKAKYVYFSKTELHGVEEVTVMSFYHTVGVEQGIYITPEEAFAQLFHHDTSSQLHRAVSGLLPFPLPQFSLMDFQNYLFNSELQYRRLVVLAVIVVLTPLNETKYSLSRSETGSRVAAGRWDRAHRIGSKISGLLRI